MTRGEWIGLGGLVAGLAALGVISVHGSFSAASDHGEAMVKTGLANVTADQDEGDGCNRWNAPAWQIVNPLRSDHPLFRRPCHIGENRHRVMCDNGWYYDAPENQGI